MNFSTLFRLEENLQLDKKTLVILRYIAIFGQLFAVNIVYNYLNLSFPIIASHIIILVGLSTNLYLQFQIKSSQLKDIYASLFLIYDLIQLSALLYLTGGILNPFSFLLIIPTIVSSTFLSMGTTIVLGFFTSILLLLISYFYLPLPGIQENTFTFPIFYKTGILVAIFIGLIFLSYFGIRFAGETKKRSEAFNKLQEVISKEYELESLGGQAAAAAHSLGTPLATISVVAKELKKDIGDNTEYSKDIDLLISQTKRCSEILKKISKKQIEDDQFISSVKTEDLIEEIINSFRETSSKEINLICEDDENKIDIQRTPEIIYGLRNFIGNANKFAKEKIFITLKSNNDYTEITIEDDGGGYPSEILSKIGEPYLRSLKDKDKRQSGLGLGIFIGKNLLEKNFASLNCQNSKTRTGAEVNIRWKNQDLKKI